MGGGIGDNALETLLHMDKNPAENVATTKMMILILACRYDTKDSFFQDNFQPPEKGTTQLWFVPRDGPPPSDTLLHHGALRPLATHSERESDSKPGTDP